MDDNFKSIDYASLYGVKPGEKDFGGAMERATEEGPKHVGEDFLNAICQMRERRREEIVNSLQYNAAKEALRRNANSADDFEDGAEYGYQFAIEKVCKWFAENYEDICLRWLRGYSAKDFVEFFKEEHSQLPTNEVVGLPIG